MTFTANPARGKTTNPTRSVLEFGFKKFRGLAHVDELSIKLTAGGHNTAFTGFNFS
jgi:hypothetical protein